MWFQGSSLRGRRSTVQAPAPIPPWGAARASPRGFLQLPGTGVCCDQRGPSTLYAASHRRSLRAAGYVQLCQRPIPPPGQLLSYLPWHVVLFSLYSLSLSAFPFDLYTYMIILTHLLYHAVLFTLYSLSLFSLLAFPFDLYNNTHLLYHVVLFPLYSLSLSFSLLAFPFNLYNNTHLLYHVVLFSLYSLSLSLSLSVPL